MTSILAQQLDALLGDETDRIANLANTAALLHDQLPDLNWVGFYLLRGDELVVGPFQGLPACVRIPLGRGVCGTAAQQRKTIIVEDVNQFDGHIACDARSRSEIVIPIIVNDTLIGVLDVDSPTVGRFGDTDAALLAEVVAVVARRLS